MSAASSVPSAPVKVDAQAVASSQSFTMQAKIALEGFLDAVAVGETGLTWNKLVRGQFLYSYAWASCKIDEDFSKATWDQHVGIALAAARAKRELTDTNAKRWVYWFALQSLGIPQEQIAAQPSSVLRALERLVEFQGIEDAELVDVMVDGPVFAWFDEKAAGVAKKICNRKVPLTGDAAVAAVNAAFPDRIKSRSKVDDDAETASKSSKSSTTVESESGEPGAMNLAALNSGSLAGLVRSWFAQASIEEKVQALKALDEVLRPHLAEAKKYAQAAKSQAASAGIGSVAPQSVAASAP